MLPNAKAALPRTSPEQQGVSSAAILRFVEALDSRIDEPHSLMLLRHGSVIAEGWWAPYRRDDPHQLFSLSKSFTATAAGLAMAEGRFSIDDPVISFFPDEIPADPGDFLAALSVRHLLTMATGQAEDAWSAMLARSDGDWIRAFFSVPPVAAPGSRFAYSTGATHMLAAIVQQTTGMKLRQYLAPRLFEPLGIERASWEESPQGIALGGIGLSLATEDVARFGQLYVQQGQWQGRQLVPQAWVEQATAAQIANGGADDGDWTQGYGYQFWRCRHGAYRGDGVFGQYCVVMPEQDAVLVITGGMDVFEMQQPLNLVWDLLLPAMGGAPLAEDAVSQRRLAEKLADLRLQPVRGGADSPIMAHISGRSYRVDPNELNIESIRLDVAETGWAFTARTAAGEESIPCGHGAWAAGQTALFRQTAPGPAPIAAAGAWTADDTFTMIVRLLETPFYHTVTHHFIGDELLVTMQVNVSLESMNPLLLTARRADS